MYRYVSIPSPGGPEVLELREGPAPEPGPGEARIRVEAAGVAFPDTLIRTQTMVPPDIYPLTPGYDAVGVVEKLGESVAGLAVGQRVIRVSAEGEGGYATMLCHPAAELVAVPDGVEPGAAVSVGMNSIMAYQMVFADLKAVPGTDASDELRTLRVPNDLVALIVRSVAINPERRLKNATEWERRLGNLLGEHFFVEIIWVPAYRPLEQRRGSVMEAIGSPENLEIAAYVYEFLARAAEQLWRAHKQQSGLSSDRDRLVYYAGVMSGFAQKLAQQARAHKADGLVWVPQARLTAYARQRHPYLRTVSHTGSRRGEAFAEGQRAGREVLLHRGMTRGSSGETKLLKS